MGKFDNVAKKLQNAINGKTQDKILLSSQQWFSEDKHRPITVFYVKQSRINNDGKRVTVELFKTYSQVQLVLFLRDYWYELNGWEVPTDNKMWEEVKQDYANAKGT